MFRISHKYTIRKMSRKLKNSYKNYFDGKFHNMSARLYRQFVSYSLTINAATRRLFLLGKARNRCSIYGKYKPLIPEKLILNL